VKYKKFKQLLKKHIKGHLNEIDEQLIDSWYDSFGYSENIKPLNDPDHADQIEKKLLEKLQEHIQRQPVVKKITVWRYSIAASFLLAGILLFIFHRNQRQQLLLSSRVIVYDTIATLPGELKKVKLPDSSEVWMNAGSRLRYISGSFTKSREIYLDQGEAFFSVVKDPKRPFQVHTPLVTTRVLGTSFNIKAYAQLNYTSVLVKTGRVKVSVNSGKKSSLVTADQGLVYDKLSDTLLRKDLPGREAGSWIDGNTALHEVSFKELALIFYNRYQLKLTSVNPAVLNYHYTISIMQKTPVDASLKLICGIHNNHYRRGRNEIEIQ
jgi:ferric-dicitrate binding protein FerR (iron transport regulator)